MNFQPLGATILTSQKDYIVVAKQAVLADHGREVRSAINSLPSDVARQLTSGYGVVSPGLIQSLEGAITQREFAIESAANEANVDQAWLQNAQPGFDRRSAHENDEWNEDNSL